MSERDRFIADLVAALRANDEFASGSGSSSASSLQPLRRAGTRNSTTPLGASTRAAHSRAAAATNVLPPSAFTDSDESDSSSRDGDASDESDSSSAQRMFTGLFHERWTSSSAVQMHTQPSTRTQQRLAHEAYERLQFDFPQIDNAQLLALAESYRSAATLPADDRSSSNALLPITTTLIDGVVYLTEKSSSSSSSTDASAYSTGNDARGLLAASVLLALFECCLRYGGNDDERVRALLQKLDVPSRPSNDERVMMALESTPSATTTSADETFALKLAWLATRTFSSMFASVSPTAWTAWRLDRTLFRIVEQLLLQPRVESSSQVLYGHPHGEWTRYVYVLRDRVLQFPSAGSAGIETLRDLVQLLQPTAAQWNSDNDDAPPHQLVYRVFAELALSHELTQRAAQPAVRALAAAVQDLLPLVVHELERVAQAARAAAGATATASDDDLVRILVALAHVLLTAATSRRVAAETLQTSGLLRALLAFVPSELEITVVSDRQWFAPLLRLVAECALWSADWAAYVARVPKIVALLPQLRAHCHAELALLLVALHTHALQAVSASAFSSDVIGAGRSLWDVAVADALFPRTCASYLDAMQQLQDAIYFLECVSDALPELRPRVLDALRASLQRVYPTFSHAFAYPSLTAETETTAVVPLPMTTATSESDADTGDREERGAAEALQFHALRNKLRQAAKSVLLRSGSFGAGVHASSKLD